MGNGLNILLPVCNLHSHNSLSIAQEKLIAHMIGHFLSKPV